MCLDEQEKAVYKEILVEEFVKNVINDPSPLAREVVVKTSKELLVERIKYIQTMKYYGILDEVENIEDESIQDNNNVKPRRPAALRRARV